MKRGLSILSLSSFLFLVVAVMSCTKEEPLEPAPETDGREIAVDARSAAVGSVYLIDNDASNNKVIAFGRSADGSLSNRRYYSTGGQGTGGGLGSQGAVVLYRGFLFVCNAGSNEVSVFNARGRSLNLVDIEYSHGQAPVSLTVHGNLVYVLNAGGDGNIAGFSVDNRGDISFLPGSVQPLSSSAAGGAQVSFNHRGNLLVVTEKATNAISIYYVGQDGLANSPTSFPSAGATPFGFGFGNHGELIVSEAFGGAPGASTVSSYSLSNSGNLQLITGPVATNQTAACWIAIPNNGRYAYTTNTGSASVTGYSVSSSGVLELLNGSGVTANTGAGPIDAAFSRSSSYLYTLNAGDDSISLLEVGNDGSLANIGTVSGLPDGAVGLAAE